MFDSLVTHSHSSPFSLARKYKILGNGFASPNKMRGRISIIVKKEEERPKIVVGGKGCDTNENFTEKKISFFSLNEKNSYSNEKLIPRHIDPNPERGRKKPIHKTNFPSSLFILVFSVGNQDSSPSIRALIPSSKTRPFPRLLICR